MAHGNCQWSLASEMVRELLKSAAAVIRFRGTVAKQGNREGYLGQQNPRVLESQVDGNRGWHAGKIGKEPCAVTAFETEPRLFRYADRKAVDAFRCSNLQRSAAFRGAVTSFCRLVMLRYGSRAG